MYLICVFLLNAHKEYKGGMSQMSEGDEFVTRQCKGDRNGNDLHTNKIKKRIAR